MILHIKSNTLFVNINKELANITDKAKVVITDINYNKEMCIIQIFLKRYPILFFKKSLLGINEKPIYNHKERIKSILIIKNITNYKLTLRNNTEENEITILFGINIKKNKIYFSSAEEKYGEPLLEIDIEVDSFDISVSDI